jgi:Predicted ATP-dependent endonuclease of the OLD family
MGAGIQSAIVVALIQAYKELKRSGAILLIEEPEVYLHPHARRYFYSLLEDLAEQGNQIIYTTHSTEFVNLPNYETICIVRKTASSGTTVNQTSDLSISDGSKEELKLLTQFDATRNELFFARKVLLVEGATERFSLPYIFTLKGIDLNARGVSIIDSGSKENLEFIIKILKGFYIPFVVLHDEDTNANNYATYHSGVNGLNARIQAAVSDASQVFRMNPDFEGVFGISSGGDKIRKAIERLKNLDGKDIPKSVNNAIDKLNSL